MPQGRPDLFEEIHQLLSEVADAVTRLGAVEDAALPPASELVVEVEHMASMLTRYRVTARELQDVLDRGLDRILAAESLN